MKKRSIHTSKSKEKLSIANRGRRMSVDTEIKQGQRLSPKTEFKKGMTPWNKGLKGVMKPWNKGKKMSIESCKKMSLTQRKIQREKWDKLIANGYELITPKNKLERHRFRNEMQKQVFERDNYTCQICDQRGGRLQVDHIQSWSEYVELRFEMKNLRTLCMDCHYLITYGKKKPKGVIWGHNFKKSQLGGC